VIYCLLMRWWNVLSLSNRLKFLEMADRLNSWWCLRLPNLINLIIWSIIPISYLLPTFLSNDQVLWNIVTPELLLDIPQPSLTVFFILFLFIRRDPSILSPYFILINQLQRTALPFILQDVSTVNCWNWILNVLMVFLYWLYRTPQWRYWVHILL